ncbi:reactive intermediate/imine deaminase [Wenjunlia vitaminophila]|uniref:Reactive intermediate/imine deaminase n=1 Tax=Wenjunlia vitaminophila TaxID=76728 RepID=A0A0T6LLL0_WENVI|nr:RidA family protein [Wenjunlia vitaminophila]KRV46999.1 reactive intermediate/imine deaminase [Wenjunlia vitaminophila]
MSEKTAVVTDRAPRPPASFSQGVRKGNLLQVAGQVGFDPASGVVAGTGLVEQAEQTLRNVQAVLEEGGASWTDVVMMRVYLTDTSHFAELNRVYDEWFSRVAGPHPARTTVYVGLPAGLLVEIDALAVLD